MKGGLGKTTVATHLVILCAKTARTFMAKTMMRPLPYYMAPALTCIPTPLRARKAFSNVAAQGVAVTELRPQDPKATEEILTLFREVFEITMQSQLCKAKASPWP